MLSEICLVALVLTVSLLVAGDFSKTKSEGAHDYADASPDDVRLRTIGGTRAGRTEAFLQEPAGPARCPRCRPDPAS